jgi:hypothetical protein
VRVRERERKAWGTLTLTLSRRERGQKSMANKIPYFCTRLEPSLWQG